MLILTMTKTACIKNASALSLRHYSAKTANRAKWKAMTGKLQFQGLVLTVLHCS